MLRLAATLVTLAALAACAEKSPEPPAPTGTRVLLVLPDREDAAIPPGVKITAIARVELADDDPSRARGLMQRTSLRPDHGMLFVYPTETTRTFWMKNTLIPLSIAFATSTGRIVDIQEMVPGGDVPDPRQRRYRSARPATYALEMAAGWFAAKGIRVGDRMEFHPEVGGIPGR